MIHTSEDYSKAKQMCELFPGSKVSIISWAHFLGVWISVNDKQDGKQIKKKIQNVRLSGEMVFNHVSGYSLHQKNFYQQGERSLTLR